MLDRNLKEAILPVDRSLWGKKGDALGFRLVLLRLPPMCL